MAEVISFVNFRPPPRFDSIPWTDLDIEESSDGLEPWTQIDTIALVPVDADPEHPQLRNFTTEQGTALDYWYRIIFKDASSDESPPTIPIQNTAATVSAPVVTAYATTDELARILRIRTPTQQQETAMQRVLDAAALEIDSELGITSPYTDPPALVVEVNLERAVEHWSQQESPFGIIGLGDTTTAYTARDSWDRHAHKLSPLKVVWGARMTDATLLEVMAALADQIRLQLGGDGAVPIAGLQVEPSLVFNPTPPCIDVYPADPFTEQTAMGFRNREIFVAVRARVTTADTVEGQELLLDMMDVRSQYSVAAAILEDSTLGGTVGDLEVQGPSGYTVYTSAAGDSGKNLLGCEWRTRIVL